MLLGSSEDGGYFRSVAEADEWLDMEAGPEERERACYAENDRFTEWARWQKLWEDEDATPDVPG